MSNNPYATPSSPPGMASRATQANMEPFDLEQVESGQKLVIYAIMGYFCSMLVLVSSNAFLGGTPKAPVVTPVFGVVLAIGVLGILASAIGASVGIFRMGGVLYPGSTRYVYAAGVLIPAPLIGLLVMFVANSAATKYLKARGIKVGFFGASR